MGRTDRAVRVIRAPPDAVFAALVDPQAWLRWLPPEGMTGEMHEFDLRPGGIYRMTLTYADRDLTRPGKTGDFTDTVAGRFVEIEPSRRIVQEVRFVSDDPAFAGTMRMSWLLAPAADGTEMTILCENVPAGIRAEDHDAGLRSTLANLAAYVEAG